MRPDETAIQDLIGMIYDAALEPARWQDVLVRLSDATRSVGAMLMFQDLLRPQRSQYQIGRLDPNAMQTYLTRYAPADPWTDIAARLPVGEAFSSDAFVPAAELMKTKVYAEVLKPQNIRHAGGAILIRDVERSAGISVFRAPEIGPPGSEDLRLLSTLAPHFKRAAQIAWRLGTLAALDQAKGVALDNLDHGILLVDERGLVLFANRVAEAIIALRDGVTIAADGVRAAKPADTARLRNLLAAAMNGSGGGTMRVGRPSLAEPFLMLVAPARAHFLWPVDPGPAAVIFITDPDQAVTPDAQLLVGLFDLTVTEAKVAVAMAAGKGLPETARALRISANTAHTHLQRIFHKCGVNRQAELVRLLTRMAAVLPSSGRVRFSASRKSDRS